MRRCPRPRTSPPARRAGQFARDRQRLNRLREAGWTVVLVTAADLRDPLALVGRVARALGRAR
ncbi:hypothetical protein E9565_05385 [Blastococcus sp. KM273129]|nr:hypothetical protein [Blastococcus sp. KM273129]